MQIKLIMDAKEDDKLLLPHHEQQELCTTRLPYRQGRKLTAIKVYTINDESRHLLAFGVPSLNLRQETKSLFMKFGRLTQFNLSTDHRSEVFTETYHVAYEKIQSARYAKKMLDTKNFYGGNLHICYAPELESLLDTREKLSHRKHQVLTRLNLLETEEVQNPVSDKNQEKLDEIVIESENRKVDMGKVNTIVLKSGKKRTKSSKDKSNAKLSKNSVVDVVDCSSVDKSVVTNVDLNILNS